MRRNSLYSNSLRKSDYYPFGMVMRRRSYVGAGGYRYGFNGKEKDDEVKGAGNELNFGDRTYDPRLGRWMSIDPKSRKGPDYSPYSAFVNNLVFDSPILINGDITTAKVDSSVNIKVNVPMLSMGTLHISPTNAIVLGRNDSLLVDILDCFLLFALVVVRGCCSGPFGALPLLRTSASMLIRIYCTSD